MDSEKLGKDNVISLLFKLALPSIMGSLVFSLYMITDAIFIERNCGTTALAGVFITFPAYMIMTSFSNMLGLGAASMISRFLGEKNLEGVKKAFGNYLLLVFASAIFVTTVSLVFMKPILQVFGASSSTLPFSMEYMRIIFAGALFFMFGDSSNAIIRSEGGAKYTMTWIIISSLTNVFLDWYFMVPLKMGVTGAALATLLAGVMLFVANIYYFARIKTKINLAEAHFRLDPQISKNIFKVGFSTFTAQFVNSGRAAILNHLLAFYGGDLAIAAYGILMNIFMFIAIPISGLMQGMQPILGYNYGAKLYKRAKESMILTLKWGTIFITIVSLLLIAFPKNILAIFTTDQALIEMTAFALILFSITNPLTAIQMISGGIFQALGKAKQATILPLIRQLFILIPLIVVLSKFWGLNGIWYSFPLADIFGVIIVGYILLRELKRFDKLIAKTA
ncbi:MAG: MATE family efflux transporter [Candidatus Paceibacterota bacterium]